MTVDYCSATATVNGVVGVDGQEAANDCKLDEAEGAAICQFWAKNIDVNRTITVSGGQFTFSKSG